MYVAGWTFSQDFPTENPLQPTYGGGFGDGFVSKIDSSGSALVYSTYLGGIGEDIPFGIAVDADGNAYIAGRTGSPNFPTTPNAFQTVLRAKSTNAFVTKVDSEGSLVFSTYLGGSGGEDGHGIAVDGKGNVYVTGATGSADFPTANPFQPNLRGQTDAFVTKFDPSGSALVYSTYLGGNGMDGGMGIAVDVSGNAYIAGITNSLDFPTADPIQATYGGGMWDAFVTKLDSSGSALVYSTYLGGSDLDEGLAIAVDPDGSAYVTGWTASTDFPTENAFQPAKAGGYDAFVTKLNASGTTMTYSTYLGGSGDEYGRGIAADTNGNAYIVGDTFSTDFPTQNPIQPALRGFSDAFVTQFDASGSALVFSTYLGGSLGEEGFGIAADAEGNAYVVGLTISADFPTQNPFQPENGGFIDVFVTKIGLAEQGKPRR